MNKPSDASTLKWYHMRSNRLTKEFFGGVVAGIGMGAMLTTYVIDKMYNGGDTHYFSNGLLIAPMLIFFGSWFADKAARARESESPSSK